MKQTASSRKEEPSLAFGGQALIEGVMIRSRSDMVMCVRKPNKEISTSVQKIHSVTEKYKVLRLPFLRGIVALFETFYLGAKGLSYSANEALGEEKGEKVKFGYVEFAIVAAAAFGLVAFFFIVPFLVAAWLNLNGVVFNIVEAAIRLGMFVAYLVFVSRWGEFSRVLQYHGAEHKAINASEAGVPMDIANVKRFSRLHPRCGTSFIFLVVIISIILFTLMPNLGFAARLSYRILLIPVIGGIAYEPLRLSGKYRNSPFTKIFTIPGLAFQRLTTKEPTEDMIEVAVKAVQEIKELTGTNVTP